MAIPDFQTLMLPVLQVAEAEELHVGDAVKRLAAEFELTDEELSQLLPSGRQSTFANRVHWAKSYLGKAGLIKLTRRGYFEITDRGREILNSAPARIDINFLRQFPAFEQFRFTTGDALSEGHAEPTNQALTPDEEIRRARDRIEEELAQDILAKIMTGSPAFFERVVVKLVTAMGYGGSVEDAGQALGKSGDGGVDGVIDEDALGLDRIYVQAKRYKADLSVGAGAVRDFFGALDQFKAAKGLFVTTSIFSSGAVKTAENLSKRIVLIDGVRLAKLMIKYDVGCRSEEQIFIKRLDEDFFEE